jgi:hypothetical protein
MEIKTKYEPGDKAYYIKTGNGELQRTPCPYCIDGFIPTKYKDIECPKCIDGILHDLPLEYQVSGPHDIMEIQINVYREASQLRHCIITYDMDDRSPQEEDIFLSQEEAQKECARLNKGKGE